MDFDRNLLFGLRALQLGWIDANCFTEAYLLWRGDPLVSLPVEFVSRGWLTEKQRGAIERELPVEPETPSDLPTPVEPPPSSELRRVVAILPDSARDESLSEDPEKSEGGVFPAMLRYTRIALHGKGGIGQVWRGFDRVLERMIAIKELRPEKTGAAHHRERFLCEARLTAQLEHPGIVPVHELVQSDDPGRTFYTMRLIQGRTLAEAVHEYHAKRRQGQADLIELSELLQAFVTVCNTVAYAHHRGVIHRDLKGSNIILGPFGEVLVLDWGMAKRFADPTPPGIREQAQGVASEPRTQAADHSKTESFTANATRQGEVVGTPGYMAPEQAAGLVDQFDARTDIYGLGAVLYHLLTGRAPVTGSSAEEVIQKTQTEPPLPPCLLEPSVPKALDAVCLKALAQKRHDRYDSALELAAEVKRWLADEPVHAFRDPPATRAGRWIRRHRTLVTSSFAVFVVAFILLGVASLLLNSAFHAEQQARIDQEKETRRAQRAEDAARRAEKKAVEDRDAAARAEIATRKAYDQAELVTDALLDLVEAQYQENEPGFQEGLTKLDNAVRGWVQLDPQHRMVLKTLALRMYSTKDVSQHDQAIAVAKEVLKAHPFDREPNDPKATGAINLVGALSLKWERPKVALTFLTEVLRSHRKLLGPDHEDTLHATYALGLAFLMDDQFDAAAPLFAELLMPARRAQLSRDRIRRSLTNLGECQLKLQKYAAAEVSLHEAWEMSKQDVNARWPYFNVQRLLATAMLKQKRYQEAEPLLLEAHEGLVRGSGANRYVRALFIPETIDSLVELYENTGQKAKAEHWKGKRAKDSK